MTGGIQMTRVIHVFGILVLGLILVVAGTPTTLATKLTLFREATPWNAAYHFCRSCGQQLLVIDSKSKQNAVEAIVTELVQRNLSYIDIWLGIASLTRNETNYTTVACSPLIYFNWRQNEPDYLYTDLCVRMIVSSKEKFWGTRNCVEKFHFICERSAGPCWFEKVPDRKLCTYNDTETVTDVQACQDLCLNYSSSSGNECAAAHFQFDTGDCALKITSTLYVTGLYPCDSCQTWMTCKNCTLLIKRCYNYSVDDSPICFSDSKNFPALKCDAGTSAASTAPVPDCPTSYSTAGSTRDLATAGQAGVTTASHPSHGTEPWTGCANELSAQYVTDATSSNAPEVLKVDTTTDQTSSMSTKSVHRGSEVPTYHPSEATLGFSSETLRDGTISHQADSTSTGSGSISTEFSTRYMTEGVTGNAPGVYRDGTTADQTGGTTAKSWSTSTNTTTEDAAEITTEFAEEVSRDGTTGRPREVTPARATEDGKVAASNESTTTPSTSTSTGVDESPIIKRAGTKRCSCRCAQKNRKEVQAAMATAQRDLRVHKVELSNSRRKLTSAPDVRLSAHALGWVGVSFLGGLLALLVLLDCVRLARFLHDRYREGRLSA